MALTVLYGLECLELTVLYGLDCLMIWPRLSYMALTVLYGLDWLSYMALTVLYVPRSQVHLRMAEEALTDELAEILKPKVVNMPYVVNLDGVESASKQKWTGRLQSLSISSHVVLSYFRWQVHLRMAEEALTDEMAECLAGFGLDCLIWP